MSRFERTREELGKFLKARREAIKPVDVGLPEGSRRRTPGLRREEVAALSGVGVTWYTWLEQGRDIGVSVTFLDNLARIFRLNAAERRHLYRLAHNRIPSEAGKTWCTLPPLIQRLMHDLDPHPAYVLNLRWDILGANLPAKNLLGLDQSPDDENNFLQLLFTSPLLQQRIIHWENQTRRMLASFRRDFAIAANETDFKSLVDELIKTSPEFREYWQQQEVHASCNGKISFKLSDTLTESYQHTSLTVDEDKHLRLVVYLKD